MILEVYGMNTKLKDLNVEYLFKAILSLETIEECYNFFDDLCTVPELKALSQRLEVAKMLSEGTCVQRYRGENRRVHRDHQPGEPLPELWQRRL